MSSNLPPGVTVDMIPGESAPVTGRKRKSRKKGKGPTAHEWKADSPAEAKIIQGVKDGIAKTLGGGRKSKPRAEVRPPDPKPDEIKSEKGKRGGRRVPSGGISKRPGKPQGKVNGKDKIGRPPALTDEVQKEIIESVALDGMAESRAALASGIAPSTLSKWKARGRDALEIWDKLTPEEQAEELRYTIFFKALRDAEPQFEKANLRIIRNAATNGDWRAANRRLELRFPLKYGKKFQVSGDPENKTPIQAAITSHSSDLTDQEIKARAERILKASTATARATGKKAPAER